MPKVGQVLKDHFNGNSFEFLETAESSGGKRVKIKITQRAKGKTVEDHIHLLQDEHFEVLSGQLTYIINKEKNYLNSGEQITLLRNTPHNHYNTGDEPAVYIQTISPALDIDYFLENLMGMINDGKLKKGQMSFFQKMATLKYLESPSLLANIPRGVQRFLANVLGPVARRLGYRAIYKKYTGLEK